MNNAIYLYVLKTPYTLVPKTTYLDFDDDTRIFTYFSALGRYENVF